MRNGPAWIGITRAKRPLARRVTLSVLFMSGALTAAFIVLQLALDYRFELAQARDAFRTLPASRLAPLTEATWALNEDQIRVELTALVDSRTSSSATLELPDGRSFSSGAPIAEERAVTRDVPLTREVTGRTIALGTLRLTASLRPIFERLRNRLGVLVATQAVKGIITAFLFLFVLDRLIGRRLEDLARAVERRDPGELALRRPKRPADEIDLVSFAVFSAQARLREESEDKAKLERAMLESRHLETLGRVAAGVAHDLNNVLQVLIAVMHRLGRAVEEPGPARALEEGKASIDRAVKLVRQIMLAARKQAPAFAPLSLATLAEEAVDMTRHARPPQVEVTVAKDGDDVVVGDATQLLQVLLNLVLNALQAMREKGTRVEVRITTPPDAPLVRELTVSDDGPGMAPAVLAHVFEPFFTTKDEAHGTGLGLAVVRGVVEAHYGTIRVESQEGEGTRFVVRLPASARPGGAIALASGDGPR